MRRSLFLVLISMVLRTFLIPNACLARQDERVATVVSIVKSRTKAKGQYEETLQKLESYLRRLQSAGHLDRDFLLSVDRAIPGYVVFFSALKRLPRKDVQRLLAQCVKLSESGSFARHLADVGQDCDDMEVFKQLEVEETDALQAERPFAYRDEPWYDMLKPLSYKAVLAQAFVKSRPKKVTELAVAWAKQWQEMGGSQAVVGGLGRQINRLLAACGTEEAHAQVLENLKCFCIVGDQLHAFEILAAARYAPAYPYAKKIATDETIECVVWMAAVKMMASVQNENNTQDIIATIDKIVNSGDLDPMYRKEIADLKRRCVSASVPGDSH